eukprot:RCo054774
MQLIMGSACCVPQHRTSIAWCPTGAPCGGGTWLSLFGQGFQNTTYLRCRIEWDDTVVVSGSVNEGSVVFVNASMIICRQPASVLPPSDSQVLLKASLDGQLYSVGVTFYVLGPPYGLGLEGSAVSPMPQIPSQDVSNLVDAQGQSPTVHIVDELLNRVDDLDSLTTRTVQITLNALQTSSLVNSSCLETDTRPTQRLLFLNSTVRNTTVQNSTVLAVTGNGTFTFSGLFLVRPPAGYYSLNFTLVNFSGFSVPKSWSTSLEFLVMEGRAVMLCFQTAPGDVTDVNSGSLYTVEVIANSSSLVFTPAQPVLVRLDSAYNMVPTYNTTAADNDIINVTVIVLTLTTNAEHIGMTAGAQSSIKIRDGAFVFSRLSFTLASGSAGSLFGGVYQLLFNTSTTALSLYSDLITVGPCGSPDAVQWDQYAVLGTRTCNSCPDNAICNGTIYMTLEPGYWRAGPFSVEIYPCTVTSACTGGLTGTCAQGYTGPLCAACLPGFGHDDNKRCQSCPNPVFVSYGWIILMFVVAFTVLVALTNSLTRKGVTESAAVLFKILVNHLQVCARIGALQQTLPDALSSFLRIEKVVSEIRPDQFSLDCISRWTFYNRFVLYMLLPPCMAFATMILILSYYGVVHIFRQVQGKMQERGRGRRRNAGELYDRQLEEVRPAFSTDNEKAMAAAAAAKAKAKAKEEADEDTTRRSPRQEEEKAIEALNTPYVTETGA